MIRAKLAIGAAILAAASAARGGTEPASRPAHAPFSRSWIHIETSADRDGLVEGDAWEVPVEYYLDPSEDDGGTRLRILALGPWVDDLDPNHPKPTHHLAYPGMGTSFPVAAGRGRRVARFTVPPPMERNSLMPVACFVSAGNRQWPWLTRHGKIGFRRKGGFFELASDRPGNLFTYAEPVRLVARLKNVQRPGAAEAQRAERKLLSYKVYDVTREVVASGQVPFEAARDGQEVLIEPNLARRGTFLIEANVPGWETRRTTFCRIPDVQAITKGQPTRFGMTNVIGPGPPGQTEELCRIAQRLGLTWCRSFMYWSLVQPGPDVFKLEEWDAPLELARRYGIRPWFCIVGPPPWAVSRNPEQLNYRSFRPDWDAWRGFVQAATARFAGRFDGWEWLNEIVPSGSEESVDDYLQLVRIGTETARAIDPNLRMILAGGLMPRSFRLAVLNAGAGRYIDALPLHYCNGGGVREALDDLRAAGLDHVEVWEDESSRTVNAWQVPPLEDLSHTLQSNWVLTQWADELTAGCRKIIYFGGTPDPGGYFTYLMDDLSPRPVAATLAVFVSKLHGAEPLGAFSLGEGGLFHAFQRGGRCVLIASSYLEGEQIDLNVGAQGVTLTDYQGNERTLASPGGTARLTLGRLRCYLEGADPDVLKTYLVPSVLTDEVPPSYRGNLKDTVVLARRPHVAMLAGREGTLTLRLRNPYDRELSGGLRVEAPAGWRAECPERFSLKGGENRVVPIRLAVPGGASAADEAVGVVVSFADRKLPAVRQALVVSVISPDGLGNLFANGGFEEPADPNAAPAGWGLSRPIARRASSDGLGDGLGRCVLKMSDAPETYAHANQTVPLRGGQTYLYTAWVWNRDMSAGSNVTEYLADGSTRRLYAHNVFSCGDNSPHWQLYAARLQAPPGAVSASFTPFARGAGWALFDHLRLTLYEGSDFAAECHRAPKPPLIDGKLDEWLAACPIPLMGRNQLTTFARPYPWSPANLSAVAYLMWDARNLYLAVQVRDDVHHAQTTGPKATEGDSLVLGFDPTRRGPQADARAVQYYVSAALPGGGGAPHTLYRPQERSGGLPWGHLYRDSSVYELAVVPGEGTCVYELRIPLGELGGLTPGVGAKLGFSILLNDNDGAGRAAAMGWGQGLLPAWSPRRFGVVTLVE